MVKMGGEVKRTGLLPGRWAHLEGTAQGRESNLALSSTRPLTGTLGQGTSSRTLDAVIPSKRTDREAKLKYSTLSF